MLDWYCSTPDLLLPTRPDLKRIWFVNGQSYRIMEPREQMKGLSVNEGERIDYANCKNWLFSSLSSSCSIERCASPRQQVPKSEMSRDWTLSRASMLFNLVHENEHWLGYWYLSNSTIRGPLFQTWSFNLGFYHLHKPSSANVPRVLATQLHGVKSYLKHSHPDPCLRCPRRLSLPLHLVLDPGPQVAQRERILARATPSSEFHLEGLQESTPWLLPSFIMFWPQIRASISSQDKIFPCRLVDNFLAERCFDSFNAKVLSVTSQTDLHGSLSKILSRVSQCTELPKCQLEVGSKIRIKLMLIIWVSIVFPGH